MTGALQENVKNHAEIELTSYLKSVFSPLISLKKEKGENGIWCYIFRRKSKWSMSFMHVPIYPVWFLKDNL